MITYYGCKLTVRFLGVRYTDPMFGLAGLVRDVVILGAVLILAVGLSYTSRWLDDEPAREVETTLNPTTTVAVVPEEEPIVEEPKPEPLPAPKPKPAPAPKPVEAPAPKVEELGITLDDAIETIGNLAAGQTTGSVNDRVRAALVNIICSTDAAGPFESVSGSGVIIDPRGVILTNAHVAQFFLLKDYPYPDFVDCVIRTGSPARPMYKAELMFLPPTWVKDNAHKIDDEAPTGNGERDYALLRITGGVSSSISLPPLFPFLLVSVDSPPQGADVLQAGYAAGFLGGITIQNDLYASSAYTKVRDVYTFNANTVDLFSLGGSVVAQSGSSGGPVTNTDGVLVGVIVTSTGTGDTATRDLHALATSYIVRDFELERGKSLINVLSVENLAAEVEIFSKIFAPSERQALVNVIEKK